MIKKIYHLSKKLKPIIFWLFLITAILEAGWIYLTSDWTRQILLPNYSFYDDGSYIHAEGSWLSATELAAPVQTIQINCWKYKMTCEIADATLLNKLLSTDIEYHDVDTWSENEVITLPQKSGFGCVKYIYRIDRRAETVTGTRRTLKTTDSCEGIQKEPITITLGDGLDRLKK